MKRVKSKRISRRLKSSDIINALDGVSASNKNTILAVIKSLSPIVVNKNISGYKRNLGQLAAPGYTLVGMREFQYIINTVTGSTSSNYVYTITSSTIITPETVFVSEPTW